MGTGFHRGGKRWRSNRVKASNDLLQAAAMQRKGLLVALGAGLVDAAHTRHGLSETNRRRQAYVVMSPATFNNFDAFDGDVGETRILLQRSGSGPTVPLLHGFPQSHRSTMWTMWRIAKPVDA
jgi:hypothetical protein